MAEGLLCARCSDIKPCDKWWSRYCEEPLWTWVALPWQVSCPVISVAVPTTRRQGPKPAWIKAIYWGVEAQDLESQQAASKLHPLWKLRKKRTLSLTGCVPADLGCLPGWNGTSWQEKISPMSSAPHQDQQGMRMGWRNTKYRADKGPGYSMASDGEDLRATKVTP